MPGNKLIIKKLVLSLNTSSVLSARRLLDSRIISAASLRRIITRSLDNAPPLAACQRQQLVLQLSEISGSQFNAGFARRLQQALQECWQPFSRPELNEPLPDFALRCLQPAELHQLMQHHPAACQRRYLELVAALSLAPLVDLLPARSADPAQPLSAAALMLAALCYLLQTRPGGQWLQRPLDRAVFAELAAAVASPLATRQLLALFTPRALAEPALRDGLKRLWQQPALRQRLLPLLDPHSRRAIRAAGLGDNSLPGESTAGQQNPHPLATDASNRHNAAAAGEHRGDRQSSTAVTGESRWERQNAAAVTGDRQSTTAVAGQGAEDRRSPYGSHTAAAAAQALAHGTPLAVSGAGVVVLWPLLAQLFSDLGLLHQQQFISAAAREQAARCLDWLVQGGQAAALPALPVSRLLCGLPLLSQSGSPVGNGRDAAAGSVTGCASGSGPAIYSSDAATESVTDCAAGNGPAAPGSASGGQERCPASFSAARTFAPAEGTSVPADAAAVSPAHQQQLDAWLSAIASQLPGWQTLTLADIRPLFLQRAGELTGGDDNPCLTVAGEPWDVLLADWPWPLTQLHLPWRPQPVPLHWPLPLTTGTPV